MKLITCLSLAAAGVLPISAVWHPIDISSHANSTFATGFINGGTFPTGDQTYGGVPFVNTGPIWLSEFHPGANPRVIEVSVGVFGASEVHTLLSTFWGQVGPLSSIEFIGSDTASHLVDLIGGSDFRDYNQSSWENTINGTTTVEVFNNGLGQRLDKQVFQLPADFADETLETIRFIDEGGSGVHRLVVAGLTVRAAGVPEPGTALVLMSLGFGALVGAGRFAKRP